MLRAMPSFGCGSGTTGGFGVSCGAVTGGVAVEQPASTNESAQKAARARMPSVYRAARPRATFGYFFGVAFFAGFFSSSAPAFLAAAVFVDFGAAAAFGAFSTLDADAGAGLFSAAGAAGVPETFARRAALFQRS